MEESISLSQFIPQQHSLDWASSLHQSLPVRDGATFCHFSLPPICVASCAISTTFSVFALVPVDKLSGYWQITRWWMSAFTHTHIQILFWGTRLHSSRMVCCLGAHIGNQDCFGQNIMHDLEPYLTLVLHTCIEINIWIQFGNRLKTIFTVCWWTVTIWVNRHSVCVISAIILAL